MKSLFLIFLMLVFGASARAEQKVNVDIPGGGAQDMLNMTTIPRSISDQGYDPSMRRYCTNAEGRIIRQGDNGYQKCIDTTEGLKRDGVKAGVGGPAAAGSGGVSNSGAGAHVITIQEQNPSN